MSKTTRIMVYPAITEAQALRHFVADAAEAGRSGYEPVSQAWDGTTLTVTYQHRGGKPPVDLPIHEEAAQGGGGLGSIRRRRTGLAMGSLLLVGILTVGGVVLLYAAS